jgi:RNA polymerase sigma-32 factor
MGHMTGAGQYLAKAAMAAPFLERGDEHDLAIRWKTGHDEEALHELAEAHMRLVIALAVRFRFYGLPVADLIQEGHVGLLEAAARFDPAREVRFSTYATWWIRAAMQDYVLHNWSIVRGGTSSTQKALFFNLRRLRAKLSMGQETRSTAMLHDEIAKTLGVARADVELMDARLSGPDISLNAPMGESDSFSPPPGRMDFLVDDQPLPDETVGLAIDTSRRVAWLKDAMTQLSEREYNILRERRLNEKAITLEALGARLGISKERVRQIECRAMDKLRAALAIKLMAESLSSQRPFESMGA